MKNLNAISIAVKKIHRKFDSMQFATVIILLAIFMTVCAVGAQETAVDDRIHLSGQTLSRYDFYGSDGNQAGQVFGQLGKNWYQDLSFTLSRQSSLYHKWALEFSGVGNNSFYRSPRWGNEIERLRFMIERGDVSLPYRFEAGDIYGNFSYRTLQRAMRGFLIDLQPRPTGKNLHSLQFIYGVSHRDWHEIEAPMDRTFGFSWLWQNSEDTRMSLNAVRNFRDGDSSLATLDRIQNVFSIAGEHKTGSEKDPMIIEGEIARFQGDHDGLTGPASGINRQDVSVFAQVSGGTQPFTYRLRHEVTGQDFRPAGGNVSPDRRSLEAYTAWDLGHGRHLNARWQHYKNGWETDNTFNSRIFGMGLRGPIDDTGTIDGGIDAFVETSEDDKDTTDTRVRSLQADLRKTFSPKVSGRLALSHRLTDDRNNDASDQRISQLTVGVDRVSKIFDWDGRIGLDLENRIIDAGGTKSREFTPAINVAIARNEHSLSFNYRFQRQDKIDPILLDIDTAQAGLRYQLCRANNTFGLEYLINRREDTNGIWTRATQITAFWEHTFDEYYNARSTHKAVATDDRSMITSAAGISGDALTSFALGQSFDAAVASITTLTGAEARTWGNLAMADLKLFNDIPQRQRIVLENSENKLKQAVLVIDVDGSVPGQVGDVLERTRRTLIERYGTPSEVDERGTLGPRLAERHRAGLFTRTTQWEIPGGVVRLGLPRRLDGRLKVEVHWAENLGRVRDPMWGLEIME